MKLQNMLIAGAALATVLVAWRQLRPAPVAPAPLSGPSGPPADNVIYRGASKVTDWFFGGSNPSLGSRIFDAFGAGRDYDPNATVKAQSADLRAVFAR